ncbi:GNAT family N-acetyltransferase [Flavobacterium sp. AJR]|jgi:ribosomal protein S18 acetylase RimI-like enzyme|uniref:GNAT family N-acetyltransferase n=1 Tax=Flavobacterium sp. AJR TaxID=1979369 RepID=UPI000A3D6E26|nr:GNAT family N-acetyltransferase [Flavobacterium sp. AJR]OUL61480.1 GNAT family N-acetyltransferase [Flavobacterium sp. AJR]
MESIILEKVTIADIEKLQNIGRQTFLETFSLPNTEENMNNYLSSSFAFDKLKKEIENPDSKFFFAVLNNEVIGYLKVNSGKAQTELGDNNALEIERIYVSKEFLGKKVGQLLYDKALQIAKEKNVGYVWLGVWEENHRALAFYKKNGFVEFDKHIFKLGNDEQTDIMMKLTINCL